MSERFKAPYKATSERMQIVLEALVKHISLKDGKVEYELKTPVRKLYEKLTLDENTFEPKKPLPMR